MIPLHKNSGLRLISVAEVLQRIVSKVIVTHARGDVLTSVGFLQVCTGHETECEYLIHAMLTIYEEQSVEAVLLVDESNAFNSANRNAFLHKVGIIRPAIARYVRYCNSISGMLQIIGVEEIQLMEGSTQGDSAAMAIYEMAIILMILICL